MMRIELGIPALCLAVAAGLGLVACDEEEPNICELYCDAAEACSEVSGQPFSYSQCNRLCVEERERSQSMGCGDRFYEYKDCQVDLPCGSWNDVSGYCAAETDYLDACMTGH